MHVDKAKWTNLSLSVETMTELKKLTNRKGISPHAQIRVWLAKERNKAWE